jgi:putrescine transport system permease protein
MDKVLSFIGRFLGISKLRKFFGRSLIIAVPYGWHLIFFFIPFLIVLKISFSESTMGAPPYSPLISWVSETVLQVKLVLTNYLFLIEDELYLSSYKESIKIAGLSTIICLLIGYPVAYGITRVSQTIRIPLLMMIILPFWTSFLIRVFAWIGILNNQGVINLFLLKVGLISEPLPLINNNFAVCVGIVYSYLPFMILPLYATLEKINPQLLEAAYDLGCKPFKAFLTITLPLSMRGVLAGAALVFIPSIGEFVIPELLGGSDSIMIGKILWSEFFINRDWPLASAVAVAMLVLLVLPISLFQKLVAVAEEK